MAALQASPHQRPPKIILITSSVPGEGKTTLAVSLAAYAASSGARVLLIDVDFRHPGVARELGGPAEAGVLDILIRNATPTDAIRTVSGIDLDYIPVRRGVVPDALQLFAGSQFSALLERLSAEYDYIFIDSAPVLAIAETRLLAAVADTVLLGVRWGKTRRDQARNALGLLREIRRMGDDGSCQVAAVVTQVNFRRHARWRHGDRAEVFAKYGHYYKSERMPHDG